MLMNILSVFHIVFFAGLLSEAWNGKQKLFARVAIVPWLGACVLALFELDIVVLKISLYFISLGLGLWMYGIKLKYVISKE
ncbi:hypothetical protein Sps_04680 [Shewanella psychrophila]|uniref:Uncharacterized protein n=1 Tax=Shewanella psychrophila TaxID=225848 RepID=A0A1S6HW37_9GAMM|nr:hypothetical protein Sps_04680 [Shewanella psychrophila]